MTQISKTFTDLQLTQIIVWRNKGKSYLQIVELVKKKYKLTVSADALRRAYNNYGHLVVNEVLVVSKKPAVPKSAPKIAATRATVRPSKENNSRILVISDLHAPYQHPDAVAFLSALKAKYNPTRVICMGDEVDHHAMSFHDSDPDLMSAGDELQAAIRELTPIYKLFPVVDVLDSNHGSMAYRKSFANGISRKYLKAYGDVLEAPKGWSWHNELILDLPGGNKCFFHHGLSKDAMKVVTLRGLCVVQGHFHTEFKIGYIGNPAALLWGMNTGCLIDRRALAFAYDNANLPRPVIGTGIIIDGQPKLLPMILNKDHKWTGFVP